MQRCSLDEFNIACATLFDGIVYRGYHLRWTGLKGDQGSSGLVGQWLAWPSTDEHKETRRYFMMNVPNLIGGEYRPGAQFDISGEKVDRAVIGIPEAHTLIVTHIINGRSRLIELLNEVTTP